MKTVIDPRPKTRLKSSTPGIPQTVRRARSAGLPPTHGHSTPRRHASASASSRLPLFVVVFALSELVLGAVGLFSVLGSPGAVVELIPPVLMLVAAVGFSMRRAWGWWLNCVLCYFFALHGVGWVTFQCLGLEPFSIGPLVLEALTGAVVLCLHHEPVRRQFFEREGVCELLRSRISPAAAGFLLSFLLVLANIFIS